MSNLTDVYQQLFAAPLRAAVQAENDYRQIWLSWFRQRLAIAQAAGVTITPQVLADIVAVAPIIKLNGTVSSAVKLRIESTLSADGKVGLSLASIPLSASFEFAASRTEESTLEASTAMTLSNADRDLSTLLTANGVTGDKLTSDAVTKVLSTPAPAPLAHG
jgi:hypothetical protein